MPSNDPTQRFQDILDNIVRIERYIADLDHRRYAEDSEKQDAVERYLMRICEAARKLGDGAELLCPGIPWPEIRGLEIVYGMNTPLLIFPAFGNSRKKTCHRSKPPAWLRYGIEKINRNRIYNLQQN